jgi:hypothetical protein
MPCETLVCRRLSFAAPPYARREPLRIPVTINKNLLSGLIKGLSRVVIFDIAENCQI